MSLDQKSKGHPPGILGGGQLAQMLCEAAAKIGIHVGVLTEREDDPAARICSGTILLGSLIDKACLKAFFEQTETTAIESEFIDCDAIDAAGGSSRISPSLECIRLVQNKLKQKLLLERIGVPSSKLFRKPEQQAYSEWISGLAGSTVVLKWAEMGYDGKGTLIQNEQNNFESLAADFCNRAQARGIEVYAESKIDFRREVAIIAVRDRSGEFAMYPLVISEQTGGICKSVIGPAVALGVDAKIEKLAKEYTQRIGNAVGIVGTYAVEFFEIDDGLLVNEIAPRVHNTGHYTQDASDTSQFENHWRALLGMPLGSTACKPYFAMLNLLGPTGAARPDDESSRPRFDDNPGLSLHWYFKREIRAGRKVGHVNAWGSTEAELRLRINLMEKLDDKWISRYQK